MRRSQWGGDVSDWRKALLELMLHVEETEKDETKIEVALLELRELLDSRIKLARKAIFKGGLHG